jgi:D-alanyl-D-alanine endopeptidase (penicillin-binding protein 7)
MALPAVEAAAAPRYKHAKSKKSAVKKTYVTARHVAAVAAGASLRRVAAGDNGDLSLGSNVALVVDQSTGQAVISKNVDELHPIASITKLMTAQVILDAQLPMAERIMITEEDKDTERNSRSRLRVGAELSRSELLQLALMASENRAAHALGRSYPGGMPAFVAAMNHKALVLGMHSSRFVEPTGLSANNVSTATDLVKLVRSGDQYPLIREYSTSSSRDVEVLGRPTRFANTNRLVGSDAWDISLSKTGFINEAGRCLVMQAKIDGRPLTIVLLDSWGKLTRVGDANRIRKWLATAVARPLSPSLPAGPASPAPMQLQSSHELTKTSFTR